MPLHLLPARRRNAPGLAPIELVLGLRIPPIPLVQRKFPSSLAADATS